MTDKDCNGVEIFHLTEERIVHPIDESKTLLTNDRVEDLVYEIPLKGGESAWVRDNYIVVGMAGNPPSWLPPSLDQKWIVSES